MALQTTQGLYTTKPWFSLSRYNLTHLVRESQTVRRIKPHPENAGGSYLDAQVRNPELLAIHPIGVLQSWVFTKKHYAKPQVTCISGDSQHINQ
jgi:hypothetical protein